MALSKLKIALISVNAFLFLFTAALNYFSTRANKIFLTPTGKVSDENPVEISPAGSTFTIWAFIYMYQLAMIIYTLTLMCRKTAADILPIGFYISYSLASVFNLSWLLVWSRGNISLAFVFIILIAVSLEAALFFSYSSLNKYIESLPQDKVILNVADVWCIRVLCQNGVVFYNTWVSIANCLNLTIVLQRSLNVDGSKAATGALCVLLILILAWFIMENFVIEKFTRFTFSEYIVLLVGLSGVLKKQWTDGKGTQGFVLALLVLSALLFLARIIIIIVKEKKGFNNSGENTKLIVRL